MYNTKEVPVENVLYMILILVLSVLYTVLYIRPINYRCKVWQRKQHTVLCWESGFQGP